MDPEKETLGIKERVKTDLYEEYLALRRDLMALDCFPGCRPPPAMLKQFTAGCLSFYNNIAHLLSIANTRQCKEEYKALMDIYDGVNDPGDLKLGPCRRSLPLFAVFLHNAGVIDIWE